MNPADIVVMKFGGTSVGSIERIQAVAKRVVKRINTEKKKIVVVVSAMSGETDRLIGLAKNITSGDLSLREHHQLLATGEQASAALMAMAIEKEGRKAVSLLAYQIPIKTKFAGGHNLIDDVNSEKIKQILESGIIPVVAGFQGIDSSGSYTTLGRGGSDNTAVAIAAVLGPCRCEILTDVEGVYSASPELCKKAKKLQYLNYEEMLELANSGAKVLQARSVALAHKHRVPLIVCSSFSEAEGTEIVEEYIGMEDAIVSGITSRSDEVLISMRNLPDVPGVGAKLFKILGEYNVVLDMIVQSSSYNNRVDISITVPYDTADVAFKVLSTQVKTEWPESAIDIDREIAKLSVVGEGMRNQAGVAFRVFDILAKQGINVMMVTTSEIKISLIIKQKFVELAVRLLHESLLEEGH